MTWAGWVTLVVVIGTILVLARARIAPAAVLLGSVLVLVLAGVLEPAQALSGLSDPSVVTIAALTVIARAVHKTGALYGAVAWLLGPLRGWRSVLGRLLPASMAASAFLNNTPLVAMLVPLVTEWSDQRRQPPSRYLMAVTFAVSLGGMITLMGTSTNLIVSGMLATSGHAPIGLFEITWVGLPVALVGLVTLMIATPWVLGDRLSPRDELRTAADEFLVQMVVVPGGPLDGHEVELAGLRRLQGVFLVEIERQGHRIAPVSPSEVLRGGDVLTFAGRADRVVDLHTKSGLASVEAKHVESLDVAAHSFYEAVLGPSSPLGGRTLKEAQFRGRYQAAVVAIHRAGRRLREKLGDVVLRPGDTLLFLADPGFRRGDFLLVCRIGAPPARAGGRESLIVVSTLIAVVGVAGAGILPILQTALIGVAAILVTGVFSVSDAREALDLDLLLAVAGSIAIGRAIDASGLDEALARSIVAAFSGNGPHALLVAVVLLTTLLAQVLTCNAAGAIALPIAVSVATSYGLDPRPFAIAVALAASVCFATPLGYQTKLMIYGPGGYRFSDYLRLGLPVTLTVTAAIIVLVPLIWPFPASP